MAKASRTRVAILFGGRSAEHEISLRSARNVIDAIDRNRFEPVLIGIDRRGNWFLRDDSLPLLESDAAQAIDALGAGRPVSPSRRP